MIVQITPSAIANIGWRVFIIFAVLNALWIPLIYVFFPETKVNYILTSQALAHGSSQGLELEDIDHIFEQGGITGGVWNSEAGVTLQRGIHATPIHTEGTLPEIKEH